MELVLEKQAAMSREEKLDIMFSLKETNLISIFKANTFLTIEVILLPVYFAGINLDSDEL
ncbi:MAG: hypothetical protein ACKO8Q_00450 [Bacteroidota bacterium]